MEAPLLGSVAQASSVCDKRDVTGTRDRKKERLQPTAAPKAEGGKRA